MRTAANRSQDEIDMRNAVAAACRALVAVQNADGSWEGELRTSIIHDVEDLLLRQYLGVRTAEQTEESARWIRSQRRPDGTWSNSHDGPPELSITIAGYLALRLAGDDPSDKRLARCREYIREAGGMAAANMFMRTWLALFGLRSWRDVPALPPQIMLAPAGFPLNVYRFASWVRTNIVPMIIVGALRPVGDLGVDLGEELFAGTPRPLPPPARLMRRAGRLPFARRGLRAAERWILERQEPDGTWFSSRPPVIWSAIALRALGYPLDHPVLTAALASLETLTLREDSPAGPTRRAVIFNGRTWDTAGAVLALTGAGYPNAAPELVRARDYLLSQQNTQRGEWSVARPDLAPGGWPFFHASQRYADVDDTAMAMQALTRLAPADPTGQVRDSVASGAAWSIGMQCTGGGWAAFDADNTSALADRLLAYTTATDQPCPEITGHVLEALRPLHDPTHAEAVRRGLDFLLATQSADGSWPGRWMVHHVYGTSTAVCGLVAAGLLPSHPAVRRGLSWLTAHQNDDGGWGEDLRGLTDPDWIGRGQSTPSQTAWALLAFVGTHAADHSAARAGVAWLVDRQLTDGTWDEPQSVGVIGGGKVGYIPVRYDLSRVIWPTLALTGALAASSD